MPLSVHAQLTKARRLQSDDPAAARTVFADVLSQFPANRAAAAGLGANPMAVGRALLAMGRAKQAAGWYAQARGLPDITRRPQQAAAHLQAGEAAQAEALLTAHLAECPSDAAAWNNLGTARRMQGQGERAADAFDRATQLAPDHAPAWFNLSGIRALAAADLTRLGSLLAGLGPRDQALLHFALGNGWDRAGDTEQGFDHFAAGNALRRAALGYDLSRDVSLFAHLAGLRPGPLDCAPVSPAPVFIVGLPRSGTTLLEQMLARHPAVQAGGEQVALAQAIQAHNGLNAPLDADRVRAIRDSYLARRISGTAAFVTDKMPLNFRLIGIAAAALPEAVFLHIRRDPMATCWSNFRHYFTDDSLTNGFTWDLTDLGRFHGLYTGLMAHWHRHLPGRVLDVSYEALTAAPDRELARVCAHLNLPLDAACLHPEQGEGTVQTASALQVRRPIYQGSSGKWRDYAPYLDPLQAGLAVPAPEY